jgi:tetratricopeptide (TPR) repeat protein
LGRYDEALEVLERAAEVYRESRDPEATARATAQIGRVHRFRGTTDEGVVRLQPVLDSLAWSGPSQGLASLHAALAHLFFAGGRYADSVEAAERASELARTVGDDRILAEAEVGRGSVLFLLGQVEEGLAVLEEALPLAQRVGDLYTANRALSNAGEGYAHLGDLNRARQYIERALEICERTADMGPLPYVLGSLAEVLFYLGDWEGAHARVDRAAATVSSIGTSWFAAYPPLHLGRLYLAEGEWEEAARSLEVGLTAARQSHDLQALTWAECPLAELDLLEGRPEAALARLEPLLAEQDVERGRLLPLLAWAHLEMGDIEQAERNVVEAVKAAADQHAHLRLVEARRVQGMILARAKRWQEAERSFAEAVSLARGMSYPYAEARALHEHGRTYLLKGDRELAQKQLEEALVIFRRLGAKKDADRTKQALVSLDRSADPAR